MLSTTSGLLLWFAGAYRLEVLAGHASGAQTPSRTVDFDLD